MSILSELKKLTGKQNAKVVSEALPDEFGGSGSLYVFDSNGGTIQDYININDEWFNDTEFVLRIIDGPPNWFRSLRSVCKLAQADPGGNRDFYRFQFIDSRLSNNTMSVYEVTVNSNTRAYTVQSCNYTLTTV